ncbi:hypothetical protein BDY21DRAFT_33098 [Lineolata rhizophorae]|uniref:Rhodopsin domain-containing protein n=1 Tax=Lineolata rhizophorae TaxID=578093 RepID=A0A6A6NZU2_9PEZI|nr:hypothetical protein BDY21DRAFT_33098 [Lineolata rhizophorae]
MPQAESGALHPSTPDDAGGLITSIAFSLLIITVIACGIRSWVAWMQKIAFSLDDTTFLIATCLAVGQSVITERAVDAGLGQHVSAVPEENVTKVFKFLYATRLLGLAAQSFAKLSVTFLFVRLVPHLSLWRFVSILSSIVAWSLFGLFAVAFQCGLPDPWTVPSPTCSTGGALFYPVGALNIATDALLAGFIMPFAWSLKLQRSSKVLVCTLFGSRFIVCGLQAGQFAFLPRALHSSDPTCESLCLTHQTQTARRPGSN